jgi:hypothetical protein
MNHLLNHYHTGAGRSIVNERSSAQCRGNHVVGGCGQLRSSAIQQMKMATFTGNPLYSIRFRRIRRQGECASAHFKPLVVKYAVARCPITDDHATKDRVHAVEPTVPVAAGLKMHPTA